MDFFPLADEILAARVGLMICGGKKDLQVVRRTGDNVGLVSVAVVRRPRAPLQGSLLLLLLLLGLPDDCPHDEGAGLPRDEPALEERVDGGEGLEAEAVLVPPAAAAAAADRGLGPRGRGHRAGEGVGRAGAHVPGVDQQRLAEVAPREVKVLSMSACLYLFSW